MPETETWEQRAAFASKPASLAHRIRWIAAAVLVGLGEVTVVLCAGSYRRERMVNMQPTRNERPQLLSAWLQNLTARIHHHDNHQYCSIQEEI
jgi:hypothetical protein